MFNPKQMQQAMRQMGMDADELDAVKVTVDLGETQLVFNDPELTKLDVKGQTMFQLMGEYIEEGKGPAQEDIDLVAEKAGVDEDAARAALEETGGDIAAAVKQAQA
jgi:nascent polypeptide-associated complex subunit alpha